MNRAERIVSGHIKAGLPGVTPGVCVQAYKAGRKVLDLEVGKTYRYYDLASLTKILFSASALMLKSSAHPSLPNWKVHDRLPWFAKRSTRVRDLLTHSAGLNWWEPFYKTTSRVQGFEAKRECLRKLLEKEKMGRAGKSVYSDLDLFVVSFLLEDLFEENLLECWNQTQARLHLDNLFFHPENRPIYSRTFYAPTEKCPWRKRILQGEVHDENAWALGGVSTHAGLFGTIDGVSHWGLKLRKAYLGVEASRSDFRGSVSRGGAWRPPVVRRYLKRAVPVRVGDWALGFMMPTSGKASCGRYFSSRSIGHTGFTGTSFWFDPRRDLMVVILSNRVHPTRENKRFLQFRPQIHDWIVEALEG